jgi:membrane protein YqaA with SNARE-associated domain
MDDTAPQSASAPAPSQARKGTWSTVLPRLLVLAGITALTLAILLNREQLRRFAGYGYPGIFLISLLGSATVIVPAPSIAVVFAMGGLLNPFLLGPIAGLGEALGETTGYLAGATGRAIIADRDLYQRVVRWTRRYGLIPIFVLSAVPNPVFDIAGIAAGALQIPFWQFLLVCFLGKTVKGTLMALLGAGFFALV